MQTQLEVKNHDEGAVEATRPLKILVPRCDIYEREDEIALEIEMPGVDNSSIDVTLERQVLSVSGRFVREVAAGWRCVYAEFGPGEYRRSFELSSAVQSEGIRAEAKDGVLRVIVPKRVPAQRRIPVATR